jgi:hypothetical protein
VSHSPMQCPFSSHYDQKTEKNASPSSIGI